MRIGMVAGEASGDLLAAGLIKELKRKVPDAVFEGVAGPAMIEAGCSRWEDADVLAVMGLVEPLKHLPELLRLRRSLAQRWTADPPDVFVGIDAPDFNLGLETRLRNAGIRTAHYVSPTVWAWREGRVRKIRKAADCVLCILPFEKAFYDKHGVRAEFVGHPKADSAPETIDVEGSRGALGLNGEGPVVAVLPGSRRSEIARLGPLFARAASLLRDRYPTMRFVTPIAAERLRPSIEQHLDDAGIAAAFTLTDRQSQLALCAADVVLLASGTAALESALLQRPTVAAYKVAPLTAFIVRAFGLLKVANVTMPNQLTDPPLVPEFIQGAAQPAALAAAVSELMDSPERRAEISERFAKLRAELALDADLRAAEAVLSLASQ